MTALDYEFEEPKKYPHYKNPSPSGDEWWDIPENYYGVLEAIEAAKNGKKILLTDELKEELFGGLDE